MVHATHSANPQQTGPADGLFVRLAEDRPYRPQESIRGKVTLKLKTPSVVKSVVVTLAGTAENSAHRSVGLSGPPFMKVRSEVFSGSNNSTTDNTEQHSQAQTLSAGTHQWDFTLDLPSDINLPNSLDSQRNQVVYTLSVLATRPREQADLMTDMEVRIRDPIFIDQEPYSLPAMFRRPFHLSRKANWLAKSPAGKSSLLAPLKALAKSSNTTSNDRREVSTTNLAAPSVEGESTAATLSLARTGYQSGERVRIMVHVSGTQMSGPMDVKARLRRICVHRNETLVDVEDVVVASGQRPLDCGTGTFELQLPRQMLSTTRGSGGLLNAMDGKGCMTVRYTMEVTLRYCVGPRLLATRPSARFRIPIVIGAYEQPSEFAQRRWSIWWRMMSMGDDAMRQELVANGLSANDEFVDQVVDDDLQSIYSMTEALPMYEPPPPSYEASATGRRPAALTPSLSTSSSSSSLDLAEDDFFAESFPSHFDVSA